MNKIWTFLGIGRGLLGEGGSATSTLNPRHTSSIGDVGSASSSEELPKTVSKESIGQRQKLSREI